MANTTNPSTAVWNAGFSYINGMRLSYDNGLACFVEQGATRDSTNNNDIILARPPLNNGDPVLDPFVLNIGLNGAGGLDVGVVQASTLYYVFAIASSNNSAINVPPSPSFTQAIPPFAPLPTTSPVVQAGGYVQANVMMSKSIDSPVLPFGYDMFKRIGAISINDATRIRKFVQVGYGANRTIRYDGPITVLTGGASQVYATIDVDVPGLVAKLLPALALNVIMQVGFTSTAGATKFVTFQPFGGTSSYTSFGASGAAIAIAQAQVDCPAGLNAGVPTINYSNNVAGCATSVAIQGYVDQL